jgi:cytosine/adenosine deaminase-related metal-dependent hydrolase
MLGLHASMTLSDATLDAARSIMDTFGVGAHVHVAEGQEDVEVTRKNFGLSPVARLAKKGILRPGTIAAHCVHVDARDIALLKKSGAFVVHNPMSNLNNAVGIAPVLEMCRKGIPVAVGTDGMSAGIAQDARLAAFLQKPAAGDAQAGGFEIRNALWEVAPAIASGQFGFEIGRIKKNAAADVIIIDAVPPTDVTKDNAWWHVLFGVLNSPVRTTIVGGKIRMRDFEITGIDETEVAAEARRLAGKLWRRMR